MVSKKYYSISEVSEMLGLAQHNLRYMDDILGAKLTKIKGRRYYKKEDIELIKKELSLDKKPGDTYRQLSLLDDDIKDQKFKIIERDSDISSIEEIIIALQNMRSSLIKLV